MQNTVKVLEQIQRVDLEITSVEEEEKGRLRRIEDANELLTRLEEDKVRLLPDIDALKAQIQGVEVKLAETKERAARNEKRSSEVKNDKEIKALTKETNEAKKALKHNEDELGALNARLNAEAGKLKAKETEVIGKTAEVEDLKKELLDKKADWDALVIDKKKLRDGLAAAISPDIIKKYETIRAKRGGRAVVPVRKEACQGCFIHIPPQAYIELKKGSAELIMCPHCHRILYVESEAPPETV